MTQAATTTDPNPYTSASEYLLVHGRLPALVDPRPPWDYRGWLLPYVQCSEMALRGPESRWAYQLEIMTTGRLPDRPIPKLAFHEAEAAPGRANIQKRLHEWARLVGWDMGGWSDFRSLLEWIVWGLGLSREPPRLHRPEAAEALYRAVNLDLLLECPSDHIGAWISEHKANGWNPTAFFPTPHPVVHLMTEMTFHDAVAEGRDTRAMTVCDPCMGTGRMLLHAAGYSLRLFGQDIDPVVCLATMINGALYAPWLSYPIPEEVFDACGTTTERPRALSGGAGDDREADDPDGPVLGGRGTERVVPAGSDQTPAGRDDVPAPGLPGSYPGGTDRTPLTVGRMPRRKSKTRTSGQLLMFDDE